jgi:Ca2+-binding RTX toxin-like protein
MAITATLGPSGILAVVGDANPNTIVVSRDQLGVILVNSGAVAVSGGLSSVFNTSLIDIRGFDGSDVLTIDDANGAMPRATMLGGFGNDALTGGSKDDTLLGEAGNDILLGKLGDDVLTGGVGNDVLTGDDGSDTMFGNDGDDRFVWNTGDGSDVLSGGNGIDTAEINSGAGETFSLSARGSGVVLARTTFVQFSLELNTIERIVLNAGAGDDIFKASANLSPLISLVLDGGAGTDNLAAGNGNDTLRGGSENDGLGGSGGNDSLDGGSGVDNLNGGAGNDVFGLGAEGSGVDTVTDASGIDTITSTINRSLTFADYSEIENLILLGGAVGNGNALQNRITGNAGANTLNGISNVDILVGGNASDTYVMDSTIDTVVEAAGSAAGVADHVIFTGLAGQTHVLAANVERLTLAGAAASNGTGNVFNNIIVGNSAANLLNGGIGNDVMRGEAGNDRLVGSFGIDTLTGGAGNDAFVFNAPLNIAHRDVIVDFSNAAGNNDAIHLENAAMTKVGAAGALATHAFFAGAAAHDADDRIVYNRANGALSYDSNGNLAGGTTLLAFITNKPALTSADFVVI